MREERRAQNAKIEQEQKTWQMLEKGASTAKILSEVDLEGKNLAASLAQSLQETDANDGTENDGTEAEKG